MVVHKILNRNCNKRDQINLTLHSWIFLQPADEFIQVNFLETCDDHGILDPDDLLCDVVDDKEKVLVIIQYLTIPHFVNSVVFYEQ